jgi:hypothetical protein
VLLDVAVVLEAVVLEVVVLEAVVLEAVVLEAVVLEPPVLEVVVLEPPVLEAVVLEAVGPVLEEVVPPPAAEEFEVEVLLLEHAATKAASTRPRRQTRRSMGASYTTTVRSTCRARLGSKVNHEGGAPHHAPVRPSGLVCVASLVAIPSPAAR